MTLLKMAMNLGMLTPPVGGAPEPPLKQQQGAGQ